MKKFADNIPIYVQLKAEMEDAILNGILKTDDALQSIRALAAQYAINPLTVSKAVQELEDEGIIYKKRGVGFYVAPDAQENLRRKHMQEYLETEVKSFVQKAAQLGIELNDIIRLIKENYKAVDKQSATGDVK
jgi:DNA-binding transcriptional regulator YhcF (GntR family)